MEKLERTLEKVVPKREEIKRPMENPLYQGFRLVEDKAYNGGTGIRYWM